jgi:short-subunit dehydrogenase
MNTFETKNTALITGASSGIGALYADRLARRGFDLILVARNRQRLDRLARQINDDTGRSVEVLVADLSEPADLSRIATRLRMDAGIGLLLNNAGVGATSALLDTETDKMEQMVALNVTALMQLSHAAAPGFVARGAGTIINIASITAVAPELLNGVYGATKAFVLAFSQSLLHELAHHGVRVQVVLPGATATEFWDKAGTPIEQLSAQIVMSRENLVDAALAGFDMGEFATVPSLPDAADWDAFEAARVALGPDLSHTQPAQRYVARIETRSR